jgi:1,4-dihydroxy-2-naphthoate octaprenyltransferase
MSKTIAGLRILFRTRPTIAWSVGGVLLGIGVAVHEVGWLLNWYYLGLAVLIPILMQGLLAHCFNDLCDYKVDLVGKDVIKQTGRKKVLVDKILSRTDLTIISITVLSIVFWLVIGLTMLMGPAILLFTAVGLWAVIAYNVPPLKLGWRPFAEWTVVFPTLITLVVAVSYVATGKFLWLALAVGVVHAFLGMSFFMTSRLMDVETDRLHGKRTTVVAYPDIPFQIIIPLIGSILILVLKLYVYSPVFIISLVSLIGTLYCAPIHKTPELIAISRAYQIQMCILHAITVGFALTI